MAAPLGIYDIIAITGHRAYGDPAALCRGLDRLAARQYYFGGAQGVDTDALRYLSRTQPGSVRTVVVPDRISAQPYQARIAIRQHASNVIELRNTGANRYMLRNHYMVDHSQRTVGFYDHRGRGGTYQTIEYARSQGKLLEVNPLLEYNQEELYGASREEQLAWIQEMRDYKFELQSIKAVLLDLIREKLQMTVQEVAEELGYSGVKTLEQLWFY